MLKLPRLEEIDRTTIVTRVTFPYIPGLLSFRESPPLMEAWRKLKVIPDVLMVDGHGYAHPRRFGIACHLGVILGIPTIGFAKTLLIGKYAEPASTAGNITPLMERGEIIGNVVRTKTNVKPVFVSIGNRITLDDAVRVTLECVKGYRIPEPIRRAHLLVNAVRRDAQQPSL